jgi:hypothetical protein
VGISELVLCDVAEHDGRPGAWISVLPGHPLKRIGLYSQAARQRALRAA